MNSELYETLGLDKNATEEEIRKAYMAKAKTTHPDKEGGETEKFQVVSFAYGILIDLVKRKQYDDTGSTHKRNSRNEFMAYMNNGLQAILTSSANIDVFDPIEAIRQSTRSLISDAEKQLKALDIVRKRLLNMKKRLKYKKTDSDFVMMVIVEQERQIQVQEIIEKDKKKTYSEYLEILENYEYTVDDTPTTAGWHRANQFF